MFLIQKNRRKKVMIVNYFYSINENMKAFHNFSQFGENIDKCERMRKKI